MAAIKKALVIGGGVGGCTAALSLRRSGVAVDLVEIEADWTVHGVGIIQPNNTLRALDTLGLAGDCVASGAGFAGWQIHDQSGALLLDVVAPCAAAPSYPPVNGITRPRLHAILVSAAQSAGVAVRLGVAMGEFSQSDDAVDVQFTNGDRASYDLVVACDGLHSQTRRMLLGTAHEPQYTGQGVWRYNLPRPANMEWGGIYFGASTKVGLVPLSTADMYMFLVSAEPGNPRLEGPKMAAMMRDRLDGFGGLVGAVTPLIKEPEGVVYKPMQHILVPTPWHRGRVLLIGDAVHATTPHLAQGAAMAIEDGVLIGQLMARDAPVPALLDEFMRRRFKRAKFVADTSRALADGELAAWSGYPDPSHDAGAMLHEATVALMDAY